MATRPDDTRVYLIFGDPTGFAPVVEAFDTTSHQIVAANVLDNGTYGVAFSSKSGMVYVLSGSPVTGGPNTHLSMFDGSSLAFVSERAWSGASPLTVSSSSDGKRLVLMQFVARSGGASTTISSLLDPVSLGDLKTFPAPMTSGTFASAPQAGALEIASTGEVISAFEPLLTNMLPARGTGTYRLYAYADDIEGRTTLLGSRTIACANSTAISPFGAIDTPGQGDVVSGTITNWGWALTPRPASIGADGSTIDVVVDGAVVGHPTYNLNRPDVAALFPGYANTNGAVGYFTIDTTALANGLHTLAWVVRDNAGHVTGVGSRYFMVANP